MQWRTGVWMGMVLAVAATGAQAASPQRGEQLALHGSGAAPACAACHGATGNGNERQGYPKLAGLDAGYLVHELASFKDGTRQNGIMEPIAKQLSRSDMEDLAAWFSSQKPAPFTHGRASPGTLRLGQEIARHGRWDRGVPACEDCHGPHAAGVGARFPRLAGQYPDYLESQLHEWRRGFRHDDPLGLMKAIAGHLSQRDMRAVSQYLALEPTPRVPPAPPVREPPVLRYNQNFLPPPDSAIPKGPFGDMVRRGAAIFDQTPVQAKAYVGNALSCQNCHLDSGRKAGAAPMWAAYVAFPAYRTKNHRVNTLAERVQGCFRFSENGRAPAQSSPTMTALLSYFYWMAQGAPTGAQMAGRGYPAVKAPAQPPSAERGAVVFAGRCAVCHGSEGQGTRLAGGRYLFPPLWGPQSFNGGAGMHKLRIAAAFVKANMPYGAGNSLSAQQAWDVAAFVLAHPRPPDPRHRGAGGARTH